MHLFMYCLRYLTFIIFSYFFFSFSFFLSLLSSFSFFFFFNDPATTEIYTLSPTRRSSDLEYAVLWNSCWPVHRLFQKRPFRPRDNRSFDVILSFLLQAVRSSVGCLKRDGTTRCFLRDRSEEHTSELQSRPHLVCRLLLEKK